MARQNIELGTAPTGVGGDTPRSANIKINAMMAELYPLVGFGAISDFSFASSGNYVRFVSGLQICWGYDTPSISVTNTDTSGPSTLYVAVRRASFPAAFVGVPDCNAQFFVPSRLIWTGKAGDSATTYSDFYVISNGSFTAAGTFYWKAIGRWK